MPHLTVATEHRRHERHSVCRPCKVFHEPTGRYIAGFTADVSAGGALLDLTHQRPLRPGDRIEVFIAWADRVLLTSQDAIVAEVKRTMVRGNGRQLVGVQFAQELAAPVFAAAA